MFDRYSISASATQLAEQFGVDVPSRYKPHYNAGPTSLLPVITHHNPEGLSFFYWGAIPEWIKNKNVSEKLINLRAESISEKPGSRRKVMSYRCIVPIDGFYLWKKISKKSSVPYRFFLKDKKLMGMAAVWEEFEDEQEETHHTFNIITTPSTGAVEAVAERMPLILNKEAQKIWLSDQSDENTILKLLTKAEKFEFEFFTVTPRIASLDANEASLMLPSAPADQFGNLTLFD